MITSEIVKLNKMTDENEIEKALKHRGITPIRWAIVHVAVEDMLISVSYEK